MTVGCDSGREVNGLRGSLYTDYYVKARPEDVWVSSPLLVPASTV